VPAAQQGGAVVRPGTSTIPGTAGSIPLGSGAGPYPHLHRCLQPSARAAMLPAAAGRVGWVNAMSHFGTPPEIKKPPEKEKNRNLAVWLKEYFT